MSAMANPLHFVSATITGAFDIVKETTRVRPAPDGRGALRRGAQCLFASTVGRLRREPALPRQGFADPLSLYRGRAVPHGFSPWIGRDPALRRLLASRPRNVAPETSVALNLADEALGRLREAHQELFGGIDVSHWTGSSSGTTTASTSSPCRGAQPRWVGQHRSGRPVVRPPED
ncbi:hypothetical protein [Streptomyces virginiae]|uniref:hypothetical protein n=1 Tax=Streptomyces virginiae TaxID=1961 RepID=UPI0034568CC6